MSVDPPARRLADRIEEADGLLACVHCGFCLSACPTYLRLGDEADSPRGRLHLMRAVAEGRLDPASDAFQTHIDRCLGCRACEPVCPSGVPYGHLLEEARAVATDARPAPLAVRGLLSVFAREWLTRVVLAGGRILRWTGIARLLAGSAPGRTARTAFAMLAASDEGWRSRLPESGDPGMPGPSASLGPAPVPAPTSAPPAPPSTSTVPPSNASTSPSTRERRPTLVNLDGCVQAGLFGRVNGATRRTLTANGYTLTRWDDGCCGALHAHSGELEAARRLARRNIAAFERSEAEGVVVNAAGCGAAMKDYGDLLADDPEWAVRAANFSSRVRDVSEWLAEAGPRQGAAIPAPVAYDPPCHLLHAQGVDASVRRIFAAVPELELRPVQRAEECCGGAGIWGLNHPDLGDRIGGDKVAAVRATGAKICATGNPGCMMQIGAGLLRAGSEATTVHPVELLDESYRRAGFYDRGSADR